jgi:hypothetical protein
MGHLEDFDEAEAERELELRREYQDVFPLFRYYVFTPDGAYLCNEVRVEQQPLTEGRPLFHIDMEDAWVWDANRPRRLIEQVEIHTTKDVTIERLKRDDGSQALTAESLQERQGPISREG